jgi:hypothetical protein
MSQADELVAQARAALASGNRLTARGYWTRASRVAPDRLDIWLDLYRVTDTDRLQDRKRCLEHIVELDPDNEEARADLAHLLEKEAVEAAALEAQNAKEDVGTEDAIAKETAHPAQGTAMGMRLDVTDDMRRQWEDAVAAGKPLVCIDHPQRETSLRCNRCNAPICTSCAVRTPVGFRCKECIKAQQATFFNVRWHDYPLAALISLVLSVPAAVIAGLTGWWFALIISPLAGGMIGGIVHWAVGRRRGRWTWLIVATCIVLGALVALLSMPHALIGIGIHAVVATGASMGVLRLGKRR